MMIAYAGIWQWVGDQLYLSVAVASSKLLMPPQDFLDQLKTFTSWAPCRLLHVLYLIVEYQDVFLALFLEARPQGPKADAALVECVCIYCCLVRSLSWSRGLQLSPTLENAPPK